MEGLVKAAKQFNPIAFLAKVGTVLKRWIYIQTIFLLGRSNRSIMRSRCHSSTS